MKKVILIPDSFKGTMSSAEICTVMAQAVQEYYPDAQVHSVPVADGGEGSVDSFLQAVGGEKVSVTVKGPYFEEVPAFYGMLPDGVAVIEMAAAAGLPLVGERLHAEQTTTYGVGELMAHALERGCKRLVVGLGGSATNDGGIGMLKALGFTFLDRDGNDVGEGGQALAKISSVRSSDKQELLAQCCFQIACDVTNPLYGPQGATYIYGPQKGVTEEMAPVLDAGMKNYAEVTASLTGKDHSPAEGAGAAGGLGFAFLSYLNGQLTPGIQLILNAVHLEDEMKDADIVVTGEGRLDHQTAMGKAPVGVAKLGKKYGAKTIAFAGSVTKDAAACNQAGIDAFFPIVRGITTLEEAMDTETAKYNMRSCAEQVFRLL